MAWKAEFSLLQMAIVYFYLPLVISTIMIIEAFIVLVSAATIGRVLSIHMFIRTERGIPTFILTANAAQTIGLEIVVNLFERCALLCITKPLLDLQSDFKINWVCFVLQILIFNALELHIRINQDYFYKKVRRVVRLLLFLPNGKTDQKWQRKICWGW